jgi:hypothetical protein
MINRVRVEERCCFTVILRIKFRAACYHGTRSEAGRKMDDLQLQKLAVDDGLNWARMAVR